jgi:glyoxylase-like metal-dependent hydrolase (beta-lactamase superfamily II)
MDDRILIKQLLSGVDFAAGDPVAGQLVNFVYLIGDRKTGDCLLVDPAWDVDGLLAAIRDEGMRLSGVLVTHYHPDHIGGDLFGHAVEGLAGLKEKVDVPVHVHRTEGDGVRRVTGLSTSDMILHDGDDVVRVGEVPVRLLHTPGHTPGSQCFLVHERSLVSGDTLFVSGCGRVDLPGGDADEMYRTLSQRLSKLPDEVTLYPGHHYGAEPTSTMGEQRRSNPFMTIRSLDDWRRLMG